MAAKNNAGKSSTKKKEEMLVVEQIERSSVNISVFSHLDEEAMIPVNIPLLLGGEDMISQKTTVEKVEEGFGQLNIMDLFKEQDFILNCALYSTFRIGDKEIISPNIYEFKARSDRTYLLNMLITPYSDLNLTKYFDEIQFMTDAYQGINLRQEVEDLTLSDSEAYEESQDKAARLAKYLHYQIFQERSMRSGVERVKKEGFMICAMFINASIEANTELQCFGECGRTYRQEEIKTEYCDCGGPLVNAPPILKINTISYAFPEQIGQLTKSQVSPISALDRYLSVLMPRNINLAINRISPEIFSNLVTIPKSSIYYSKNFEDYIEVISDWRENPDGTFSIFTAITDTRFHDQSLPSSITLGILVRDIVEGLKKGLSREEIHGKTQIRDWLLTPNLKLEEIDKYPTFQEMKEIA